MKIDEKDKKCINCKHRYSERLLYDNTLLCEKHGVVSADYCCRKFALNSLAANKPSESPPVNDTIPETSSTAPVEAARASPPKECPKKNPAQKAWNAVTSVLVGMVLILAVLLVGVKVVGLQVYTVLSGSMEPVYHTGSLIYVKEVDYKTLKKGDVITFMMDDDKIVTHRITEIVPDEEDPSVLRFKTKGDANDVEDGGKGVHYKNVIGTPVFTIPCLGYLASFIQEPPGTYIALSAGAVLLILVFLPDLLFSDSGKEKKKDEDTDN